MESKNKGDVKMTTLRLSDIEARVSGNSKKYKKTIDQMTFKIKNKNLIKACIRSRDPIEAKILARFTKK
ncbi:hypothetical protein [Oceanobacillus alkalisoli]|uniref:hypothetical protein n=1 Tax=Oceanobacillus alkalisoli TaxID=2925113 RepID=UPI001F11A28F|nr:hypothetical protein [Oceanobacillus alkalisoli]MCF3942648.1 hypothetical protein [Oceanobacillus alkalisoli]